MPSPAAGRLQALLLCLGSKHFGHLALLFDDHVASIRHAEGFHQQPEMIEPAPQNPRRRLLETSRLASLTRARVTVLAKDQ
jgi:hypothetical protein